MKVSKNIDWEWLVWKTEFFNSDDITNICWEASLVPFANWIDDIVDNEKSDFEDITNKLLEEEITMEHLKIAIKNVKSSVSSKYL